MRGNIPLIDAVVAFVIVLTTFCVIAQYGNLYEKSLDGYIKKEEVRALFYDELFSGKVLWSDLSDGNLLSNGLLISEEPPPDGFCVKFFMSVDGNRRVFFVCRGA